ncbi:MAG: 50S ribosomal protein L31 [Planctomycetota bacterium]
MKADIHPKYQEVNVSCACGNRFTTRATVAELSLDICNVCHPFYTGRQKFVDTAGRVEKFQQRFAWKDESSTEVLGKLAQNRDDERKRIQAEEEASREEVKRRKKQNEERRKQILEQKRVEAEKAAENAAAQAIIDAENQAKAAAAAEVSAARAAEQASAQAAEKERLAKENAPVPLKVRPGGPVAARPKKSEDEASG